MSAVEQAREHIEADLHAEGRALRAEMAELKVLRLLAPTLSFLIPALAPRIV